MDNDWSSPGKVLLRHTNLIQKVLRQNGMHDAKPVASPVNPDVELSEKLDKESDQEAHSFRSNVGRPLNLATKPCSDLCLPASMLGSHVAEPNKIHVRGVKSGLSYLRGA